MDRAPVGIVLTDPTREDNPIVYANDGFAGLTGDDPEAAVGRNCRFLQGDGTNERQAARPRAAVETGESASVELRNYRANGDPFWNRVTGTPLYDDGEVGAVRRLPGGASPGADGWSRSSARSATSSSTT